MLGKGATGNKRLLEPMLTKIYVAIWRLSASMSNGWKCFPDSALDTGFEAIPFRWLVYSALGYGAVRRPYHTYWWFYKLPGIYARQQYTSGSLQENSDNGNALPNFVLRPRPMPRNTINVTLHGRVENSTGSPITGNLSSSIESAVAKQGKEI